MTDLMPSRPRSRHVASLRGPGRLVPFVMALLLQMAVGVALADDALERSINFDIPANSRVDDALIRWGITTGLSVMMDTRVAEGRLIGSIHGTMTAREALQRILRESGLSYTQDGERIKIMSSDALHRSVYGVNSPSLGSTTSDQTSDADSAVPTRHSMNEATAQSISPRNRELEEVIVTAEKREERLQDVPVSVSAVSGDRLESLRVNTLSDLSNFIPGMTVLDGGAPGARQISIRGISTGAGSTGPTTATYVDDQAVGCASGTPGGARCPGYGIDLNPYDVQGVEVLKGPQSTLYGASALGGIVKYTLYQPSLSQYQLRAGGDLHYIDGSNRPSGSARLAVNTPIITDHLGLRLSGYYQNTAGYVNNIGLDATHVNHFSESGGSAVLLWRPYESLSVKATALLQNVSAADVNSVDVDPTTFHPLNDPPTINNRFPNSFEQSMRLYSLNIQWDAGFANITSTTGWSRFDSDTTQDLSGFGAYCAPGALGPAWTGCPTYPHADALADFYLQDRVSKFVEELRIASPETQRLQWMLGGFYTRENTTEPQGFWTFTPGYVQLAPADGLFYYISTGVYKEKAGFASLTFRVTDRLDIGGGGRYSQYSRISCVPVSGGAIGPPTAPCESLPSTDVGVWSANAKFKFTPDAMIYARASTGYRPGSGCPSCGVPAFNIPGVVKPDRTTNYELGLKSELLNHDLQLYAAGFYVDWKDIQLTLLSPQNLTYSGNGGTASSSGVELTTAYRLTRDIMLNATVARTDSHLTQDVRGVGRSGDQLPISALWTASATADYSHPLDSEKYFLLGASYRYRDRMPTSFPLGGLSYLNLPPQNIVDLYTGLSVRSVTVKLYGTNVFNNHSYLGRGINASFTGTTLVPIQPAAVGLSVDWSVN